MFLREEIQGHEKKNSLSKDADWKTSISSIRRLWGFSIFRILVFVFFIPYWDFFFNPRIGLIILEESNLYLHLLNCKQGDVLNIMKRRENLS